MRIKLLNLKAFGVFEDYSLNFSDSKSFHLISGENEAGKSTLLRAVTALLYGIPIRSKDDFRFDKISVAGTLVGEKDDGLKTQKEVSFTRRKGTKNTIVDDDNKPLGEDLLDELLKNVDKEAFTNMFGLDHIRLREGGKNILKGGGQVGETLFETAAGLNHIRDISKSIEKEASDIYKKGGSKPVLNSNLKLFREEKKNVKELSLSSSKWKDLEKGYEESRIELEKIAGDIKALRKKIVYYERIKRTLPLVSERQNAIRKLEELGDITLLREGFREERVKVTNSLEKKDGDKNRIESEIQELEERLKAIDIPEELISNGIKVSELYEKLDAYRNVLDQLPGKIEQYNEVKEKSNYILREINPAMKELSQAEDIMLSYDRKKEIMRLSDEEVALAKDSAIIEERIDRIKHTLKKKEDELSKLGIEPDFKLLKGLIERISRHGDIEELLRKNVIKRDSLSRKINNKLDSLGLWSGSIDEFQALPVGLLETVNIFEEKFDDLKEKYNDLEKEKKRCLDMIEKQEKELADNEAGITVPTLNELMDKRDRRDRGWLMIKKSWLSGLNNPEAEKEFSGDSTLDVAYEDSVKDADQTSDIRYNQAEAAALKEKLLDTIKKEEERLELLNGEERKLDNDYRLLSNSWEDAWKVSGIKPLSPKEMRAWLEKCREIKELIANLAEIDDEIDSLKALAANYIGQLDQELGKIGEDIGENILSDEPGDNVKCSNNDNIGVVFSQKFTLARSKLEELERLSVNFEAANEAVDNLKAELSLALKDKEKYQSKRDEWQRQWEFSMKQINLPANSHTSIALSQLQKYEELFGSLKELKELKVRIDDMSSYRNMFEEKAETVLNETAKDLCGSPYHIAVSELIKRYEKAMKDSVSAKEIKDRIEKLNVSFTSVRKEVKELKEKLGELMAEASCSEISDLIIAEDKDIKVKSLRDEIEGLEKNIVRESEGKGINEVLNDISKIESDNLAAELNEYLHMETKAEDERSQLDQKFGAIKKDYEDKIKGGSEAALQAAEKAQSILAEIAADAERYITLKLGATVLKRGIENYRQENQDPVLNKASAYFSRLTLNSFERLAVEYDDKDDAVLVGMRDNGEIVNIEGMSDGTQDQLYLSLRLAFIEKYCDESGPLPLVFDDILINFDDRRSGETLKVLGELSRKTQVLFFTHHSKIVNLSRDNIPDSLLEVHNI